jgi:molybdopterin molybdotransferase
MSDMIRFEEALDIVLGRAQQTGRETISFLSSTGRVLAEDIVSDVDMPPFNKAAVDGFACRMADITGELKIRETIVAGAEPKERITEGTCSKIMTGAAVPDGADVVVMVEDSEELPGGTVKLRPGNRKSNIALRGEDVKSGDMVLRRGRIIRPQDVAVMAATGSTLVTVSRKPGIAIISTGSELVEPSTLPGRAEIRNSNAYQLIAQVENAGATARYQGIAIDDEEVTYKMVSRALEENDMLLLTGGVSMGDYDFVPAVLKRAGVEILFDRVAVQPGKPTTFGMKGDKPVFGLPGNPVSSYIIFEIIVRPLIMKMMECDWSVAVFKAVMGTDYRRKRSDRLAWIPVTLSSEGVVRPVDYHGSAHIAALSVANGIVPIPRGVTELKEGDRVDVRQI